MTTGRCPPASRTAACSSCSASSPIVVDAHVGRLRARTEGRGDLLGTADEERVPGLGEEAPVGEDDLADPGVGRLLQEHADVLRSRRAARRGATGRIERPPVDLGVPEVDEALDRLVEREQVAALEHRAEEGRRPRSGALHNANTGIGSRYAHPGVGGSLRVVDGVAAAGVMIGGCTSPTPPAARSRAASPW